VIKRIWKAGLGSETNKLPIEKLQSVEECVDFVEINFNNSSNPAID
jgi:hypothetical protein